MRSATGEVEFEAVFAGRRPALRPYFPVFLLAAGRYGVGAVFANLLQLITGRPTPDLERNAFIEEVRVEHTERRDPKVERLILICWILIAIKHVAVIWAVARYPVPFHQLWINFPTWMLGALATAIYYWRVRKQ
jgi:hypothetical protein